jgi:hypothetical protein
MKRLKGLFSPKTEVIFSSIFLVSSLILWPISAFTFAKEEPPAILSLSWGALVYSAYTALIAAQARKDDE